jgi:8-oxo-dGTP pyrophosphatase MutT (NUDIX family)
MSGALRETQEELGIDPAQIEVLGQIGPPEINLRGDMTVWPFVASPLTEFKMILCSNLDVKRVLFTRRLSKIVLLNRTTSHSPRLT